MTPTANSTPANTLPPRIPLREQIATRILDYKCPATGKQLTTQPEFDIWLARSWFGETNETEGKAVIRNRTTAKAMLATWIEIRLKSEGCWWGDSETQFWLGLSGRPAIQVDAPAWMTAYLRSFQPRPKAR